MLRWRGITFEQSYLETPHTHLLLTAADQNIEIEIKNATGHKCACKCVLFWVAWNSILFKKKMICMFHILLFLSCFTSFDIFGKFYLYKIISNFSIYFIFKFLSGFIYIWHRSILTIWVKPSIRPFFFFFTFNYWINKKWFSFILLQLLGNG